MTNVQNRQAHVTDRSTTAAILIEVSCRDLASPVIPLRSLDRSRQLTQATALMSQVELRDIALDRMRHGLCVFDKQQRLLLFNRLYAEMYGLEPSQLWIGMTLRDVVELRNAAGTGPHMTPQEYASWRDRTGTADQVVSTEVALRDGRVHTIHHEPTFGGGWVSTFEDITERRRVEAQVRYMAHHDVLTGLPNRALFTVQLERTLARLCGQSSLDDHRVPPATSDWLAAVLLFDLDRFKAVNDTLGHAAGDELLKLVTGRIGECLRSGDMLARLGGDEFAVLLDDRITKSEQATEIACRIISAVSAPYVLDGHDAQVGTSVGICLCARGDQVPAPAMLLRRADMALYQAKAQGGGTCCFFQVAAL